MISVKEAKEIVELNTKILSQVTLPLTEAMGLILAADVSSPSHSPPFHQSAMDGYAVALSTINFSKPIPVKGLAKTGDTEVLKMEAGSACRIFTGAPVPVGADTIIIQEHVKAEAGFIQIQEKEIKQGSNIRKIASQIAEGEIAVKAKTRLTPGVIGFLAGLGVNEVNVFPIPKIGIIVTGKELVSSGKPLLHGQVYESNFIMLSAALNEGKIAPAYHYFSDDDETEISEAIAQGLETCDLILVTGGISVGDYDFVHQSFENNGVNSLFYKVKQKPGKPLYFGHRGKSLVFGLPGNPSSVLSCFYEYVVPCIRKMMGMHFNPYGERILPLGHDTFKKSNLTNFLKARTENGFVFIEGAQESYKLMAYNHADCLVVLDEEKSDFMEGTEVEVHFLSDCWH